ncbi:GtrA family protein [Trueperella sp. LYQ143]|uniref:GtrA family protein n=1 Tax=unclassified Trueperella TaxID=2630174 RepID=UPI003982D91B
MPRFTLRLSRLARGQTNRQWLWEFTQFCLIGLGSYVVDVGLFNLLAYSHRIHLPGDPPMTAKTISVIISIIFSWLANRAWTFRSRSDKPAHTEFALFFLVNIAGLLIALGCLAVSRYVLHLTTPLADNISANIVGLFFGTIFRYLCYRYLIFTKRLAR